VREWFKNCNCDPGCPCDYNQRPTYGNCEGVVAMRITKGYFGDTDMKGVKWGGIVSWPGALHEGNWLDYSTLTPAARSRPSRSSMVAWS